MNARGHVGVPGGNSAQSMVINQIHSALLSDPSYRPDLRIGGKAGKNITEAIQEAIEKIKAANPKVDEKALNEYFNSRSQAIDLISFAQQEGQSKSDLLDALEGHPDLQEAVGEMWSEEKKPSDEMTLGRMVANIPHSSEVKDYLSGETIKKYENEEALRNAQEYQVLQLKEALAHGVDFIERAKEQFGDSYVQDVLDMLDKSQAISGKALMYVSLENDLARRKLEEPENDLGISKQIGRAHV